MKPDNILSRAVKRTKKVPWFSQNAKFFLHHFHILLSLLFCFQIHLWFIFVSGFIHSLWWVSSEKRKIIIWSSISLLASWVYNLLPANIHCVHFWNIFINHNDNTSSHLFKMVLRWTTFPSCSFLWFICEELWETHIKFTK